LITAYSLSGIGWFGIVVYSIVKYSVLKSKLQIHQYEAFFPQFFAFTLSIGWEES
jgi:hypothetical protein